MVNRKSLNRKGVMMGLLGSEDAQKVDGSKAVELHGIQSMMSISVSI